MEGGGGRQGLHLLQHCHRQKVSVPGDWTLSPSESLCARRLDTVTVRKSARRLDTVTVRKFMCQEIEYCHRQKVSVPGDWTLSPSESLCARLNTVTVRKSLCQVIEHCHRQKVSVPD